jgi:hypothetical protein
MKLALETYYGRRFESGTKNPPVKPLTKKERKYLHENCFKKCVSAYVSRMTASGLLSGVDSVNDLTSEAYVAFENIMDKFDKSKCGKIQKYDEPGPTAPKSLDFYFLNYFYGRVNFMAVDTRTEKRKRGMIGSQSSSVDEVVYNPEDRSSAPDRAHKFDSLRFMIQALETQPVAIQELFYQIYHEGLKTHELKKVHPDYLKLRRALGGFLKDFESRNEELLMEEVPGYKTKKRGRRL